MKTIQKTIPVYFGSFIILALIPQVIGVSNSVFDNIYKIALIGVLLIKCIPFIAETKYVSAFTAIFAIGCVISSAFTIISNGISPIKETMSAITSVLLVYIFFEIPSKSRKSRVEDVLRFYRIYSYFMLIAAVYNMVINFNSLIHITGLTVYSAENICSFFDNKNTYGVFLIFGVLACTILKTMTKEKRWMFFCIIFFINTVMAMCRTAILISFAVIVGSYMVTSKRKLRDIMILAAFLCVVLILVLKNEIVSRFVFKNLFGSSVSMEARSSYAEILLPYLKGVHLLFGFGTDKAMSFAADYAGNAYYHNSYLKALMVGGVLKLALQIYAIVVSLNYGLKCRRIDKSIGNLCLLSTAVYVIYAFVESVILFDTPVVTIMAVMFIISMPVMFYRAVLPIKG